MAGAWEVDRSNLVTTCILHVENVTFYWSLGLRKLVIPGPEPMGVTGMPFDHARNAGVEHMLRSGSRYLFFLDSDVVPPADAVLRLLRHDAPVISGMYCRRSPPHGVPVMMRDHKWVTDLPGPGQNPVIEVDLVGAGCLLLRRDVLEAMRARPSQRPGKPWFDWRVDLQGHLPPGECLSEDYSFMLSCRRELGVKILVDTSIRCRHLGLAEADYGTYVPAGSVSQP